MNKLSSALVLSATLALGGTARADAIQSLNPTTISSSDFNSMFQPLASTPAMSSPFAFAGADPSGVVQSQVFQSKANPNLYAYAYQIDVTKGATSSTGDPAHVDSMSFHFGNAPAPTGTGSPSYAYLVSGPVGNLNPPQPLDAKGMGPTPVELSYSTGGKTADIRAKFQDQATGAPPLTPGNNSDTFVVLSTAPPKAQQFVNLQSADPQTQVSGNFTTVYGPDGGSLQPIPAPEPATILAWAGMAGAVALVRRVRKSRAAAL